MNSREDAAQPLSTHRNTAISFYTTTKKICFAFKEMNSTEASDGRMVGSGVIVPLYVYPLSGETWEPLYEA